LAISAALATTDLAGPMGYRFLELPRNRVATRMYG